MYKNRYLLITAILCLVGFAFARPATAQNPVPFKLIGTATWDNLLNAFDPSVGATFNDGSGKASHLGKFSAEGELFATPTPTSNQVLANGRIVLVAANGDELYAVFAGPLDLSTGEGVAEFTFQSGTGRFVGASGGGNLSASLDLSTPTFPFDIPMVVTWDGEIDY